MSLEELRAAFTKSSVIEINDEDLGKLRLSKIPAKLGVKLAEMAAGNESISGEDAIAFNVEAICLSVVDIAGVRYLDNPEGRQFVADLPFLAVQRIGGEVLRLNGMVAKN